MFHRPISAGYGNQVFRFVAFHAMTQTQNAANLLSGIYLR